MSDDCKHWQELIDVVSASELLSNVLKLARDLNLPDWWLVGGAIRDVTWHHITKTQLNMPINDIDLIYFDERHVAKQRDKMLEAKLGTVCGVPWSVKNQARMHTAEKRAPYAGAIEAMQKFPETISAIGVKLTPGGDVVVMNIYGLDDLFDMIIRPTPSFLQRASNADFNCRVERKGWLKKWPTARIEQWVV
jgi:uncharacterized protein